MNHVIGEILPLAFVIALSPIPIVATVLMLLTPKAGPTGIAFLVGWILGLVIALVVFTTIANFIPGAADGSGLFGPWVLIVLGIVLLGLGVRKFLRRPEAGTDPEIPGWMSTIDSMTIGGGFRFGIILSAANPKNAVIVLAAGVAIGASGLTVTEEVIVAAVFVGVATLSVAIPVIGYVIAAPHLKEPLVVVRAWLVANNAIVMSVQSLIIGVLVIGLGIGKL